MEELRRNVYREHASPVKGEIWDRLHRSPVSGCEPSLGRIEGDVCPSHVYATSHVQCHGQPESTVL
jgi:hypothetical protein